MSAGTSILIVGGYGRAGHAVARTAARRLARPLRITVAGRDGSKAAACRDALATAAPTGTHFHAQRLDGRDLEALVRAFAAQDVVVWCAPLDGAQARGLVQALQATRTDCVDMAPGAQKYPVLRDAAPSIAASGCRYVIDAGADPGLPGWLAHATARRHGHAEQLEITARLRDRDIGAAGIDDLLDGMAATPLIFDGVWRAHPRSLPRWRKLPGGHGVAATLPVFLEELRGLPEHHGLSRLILRHAGMNPATDLLMLLQDLIPRQLAASLFRRLARAFSPRSSHVVISAVASSPSRTLVTALWREDLYEATAEAAVLGVLATRQQRVLPGAGFLWEWDDGSFAALLRERGFTLETNPTT